VSTARPTVNDDPFWHDGTSLRRSAIWTSFSLRILDDFGRLLVEKLACKFGRRLAGLKDFFFRLILEFCVLVQGKTIFSRSDTNLF
jgi:hypothetical protein